MTTSSNNTATIATNSLWYGVELASGILLALGTSIPMARVFGPERLGHFTYLLWLTSMSSLVGTFGIPGAARKYMAEYLGRGQSGLARAIFFRALRVQILMSAITTALALILALATAERDDRSLVCFLVLSIFPGMLVSLPSQANVAAERLRNNTIAGLVSGFLYVTVVTVSLLAGWDLLGIGIAILVYRAVECALKVASVLQWTRHLPHEPLPKDLEKRLRGFAGYNIALLALDLIVWQRSDLVFLRYLSRDVAQMSFYSIALNLSSKALMIPSAFGAGVEATILAQYGRDPARLPQMVSAALGYMFLFAAPLLVGLAAVTPTLIPLMYGDAYTPAVQVLLAASLLAIPRVLFNSSANVMQAKEDQRFLVILTALSALANVLLDCLLIPHLGALGAALGSGVAQGLAAVGVVVRLRAKFRIPLPSLLMLRITLSAAAMAILVVGLARVGRGGLIALAIQVVGGAALYATMIRATAALSREDRGRLMLLKMRVPEHLRPAFLRLIGFLAPTHAIENVS